MVLDGGFWLCSRRGFGAPCLMGVLKKASDDQQQARLIVREWLMNKLKISKIRNMSAGYYAVGILVFSAVLGILAVIVELVQRNS
jgi:hypothetical protein